MVWGWDNCMCILPGLVRLDLGLGAVGGGEGGEGIGGVPAVFNSQCVFLFLGTTIKLQGAV